MLGGDFMKTLNIGDRVNDFLLKDQFDEEVSLKDFKGKKILVSFHPLAWTSVCMDQMRALERNFHRFEELNVVPIGISVDPEPSKSVWAKAISLDKVKILSDFNPLGEVSKNFGVFIEDMNASGRANFLLDEEGRILWKKIYEISVLPDLEEVFEILE